MPRQKQTTTNVSLTPHWRRFVQERIKSGRYQSASEIVREGLRLVEEQEREREEQLAAMRQAVEVGWQQSRRGQMVPGDDVFDEIRQLSAAARRRTKAR